VCVIYVVAYVVFVVVLFHVLVCVCSWFIFPLICYVSSDFLCVVCFLFVSVCYCVFACLVVFVFVVV